MSLSHINALVDAELGHPTPGLSPTAKVGGLAFLIAAVAGGAYWWKTTPHAGDMVDAGGKVRGHLAHSPFVGTVEKHDGKPWQFRADRIWYEMPANTPVTATAAPPAPAPAPVVAVPPPTASTPTPINQAASTLGSLGQMAGSLQGVLGQAGSGQSNTGQMSIPGLGDALGSSGGGSVADAFGGSFGGS